LPTIASATAKRAASFERVRPALKAFVALVKEERRAVSGRP
jgi:hypothetical protein